VVGSEPKITSVTGVVLAGGRSTRMGRDKAGLQLDGRMLVERCEAVLAQCFAQTRVVKDDEVPGLGPIGGLLTALGHIGTPALFLVGCDMPFLNPALIRAMATGFEPYDAVAIRVAGRFEPLHALYRQRIAPVVEEQIAGSDYSLQKLLSRLTIKTLSDAELSRYPDWQRALLNVNTPEEWEKIRHG